MAFLILNLLNSITLCSKLTQLFACVCLLATTHIQAQEPVRAHSEMLGTNAPFSFPEKVIVGRNNDIYFLDTTLSSIFVQDFKNGNIQPLCGAQAIRSPSDMSVDSRDQLWVLSHNGSRISRLNRKFAVSAEITLPNLS
jgi:streptogramin lyase